MGTKCAECPMSQRNQLSIELRHNSCLNSRQRCWHSNCYNGYEYVVWAAAMDVFTQHSTMLIPAAIRKVKWQNRLWPKILFVIGGFLCFFIHTHCAAAHRFSLSQPFIHSLAFALCTILCVWVRVCACVWSALEAMVECEECSKQVYCRIVRWEYKESVWSMRWRAAHANAFVYFIQNRRCQIKKSISALVTVEQKESDLCAQPWRANVV